MPEVASMESARFLSSDAARVIFAFASTAVRTALYAPMTLPARRDSASRIERYERSCWQSPLMMRMSVRAMMMVVGVLGAVRAVVVSTVVVDRDAVITLKGLYQPAQIFPGDVFWGFDDGAII